TTDKCDTRHGMIKARTQHDHRSMRGAIGKMRNIAVCWIRIAGATCPRGREIWNRVVRINIRSELLKLLFFRKLTILTANLELLTEACFLILFSFLWGVVFSHGHHLSACAHVAG